MKRYFLLIAIVSCLAHDSLSLICLGNYFDTLKKNNVNNHALVQQFVSYHDACTDACNALKRNRPVADHVWYRVEIAKTIYKCGFEFFKNNIESYLFDWSALALISNKQVARWQDLSHHDWRGTAHYFSDFRCTESTEKNVSVLERFRVFDQVNDQCLLCDYNPPSKTLLRAPQKGILFFHDCYYGFIDYKEEGAILYDASDVDTQRIDFSNSIPWNILKTDGTGKASIFFNQNQMCLTFWNSYYDRKAEGQIVYQIRKVGSPVDLSQVRNYESSDIPICLIDGSCHFKKYSHAWFSFYIFQFFLKNPMKKAVREESVLNRYLFLYCASGIFLSGIAAYGVLGVFCHSRSFTFKNVSVFLSSFSALFLNSCVFRGLYQEIYC